jgi:hypothetical protein
LLAREGYDCLTMFTFFAVRMAAITLGTQKTWKGDLKCIRRDKEQDTPECMNLKNWFTSNNLRAAARL